MLKSAIIKGLFAAAFLALPFLVTQVEGAVIFKAAAAKLGIGKKKAAPKVAQKWRRGFAPKAFIDIPESFPKFTQKGAPKIAAARRWK